MYFDSLSDFLAMGGYAGYVWSGYAVSLIALLWVLVAGLRKKKRLLADIKNKMAREERIKKAKKLENTL